MGLDYMHFKTLASAPMSGFSLAVYVSCALVAILTLGTAPAFAQDAAVSGNAQVATSVSVALPARYPAGSIDSVQMAERALEETSRERSAIEARFATEESACHQKFFTNACIDAAKERRRLAIKQVRPIEIEANTFKRQMRVTERDQALAEKAAQEEQERPQRLKQQQENEAAAAQQAAAKANEPQRVEPKEPVSDQRTAQHEARMRQLQAKEAANAQKRADNVAEYEAKVREAEERQRSVATKKLEKEQKRANSGLPAAKQ
ncbi:hypothetical protein D3870_07465 [Noviherbaspirillum cavernae]|uniref:DUF4398 domain-containing protein n=1 Tax=Noviherbaspirillum cavernae TaxID=2320862 RepID=A0A418X0N1_9BURK|nr:hypothetical protein [Noviherbaspirillum cavernae]RJG05875.1 hypothetical protein D3870_07465 [Noviherbaspirillum cavernae]